MLELLALVGTLTPGPLVLQAPAKVAYSTVLDVHLVGHNSGLSLPFGTKPHVWSPDGKYFVAKNQERIWLVDADKKTAQPIAFQTDGGICWMPNNKGFYVSTPKDGIYKVPLTGVAEKVLPIGGKVSISPDGTRIAFAGVGKDSGLWVAGADGSNPRLKAKSVNPTRIEWAPDGRVLAVVAVDRQLWIVKPTGEDLQKGGLVSEIEIAWAPDSKAVLGKPKAAWSLLSRKDLKWKDLPTGLSSLSFLRSNRLAGLKGGKPVYVDLPDGAISELQSPEREWTCLLAYPGIVGEGTSFDPLRAVKPPAQGQYRLRGIVDFVDPVGGKLGLKVSQVIDEQGTERNFGQVVKKELTLPPNQFKTTKVRPDSEVAVVAKGTGFDAELTILSVQTESETFAAPATGSSSITALPAIAPASGSRTPRTNIEYDGVTMDQVTIEMIYPLIGKDRWSDSFLASRGGGSRRHHGQDLMAPKMTPLVACFDGVVYFRRTNAGNAGNMLTLEGDNGYNALYIHINNDTPGTDDGMGSERYAFAPNLQSGDRVVAGQFLGWVGDSGNAEDTGPHCHFELHDAVGGGIFNAVYSLKVAKKITEPVYVDPDPTRKPPEGMSRWDFVVEKFDSVKGVAVVDLIATIDSKGKAKVCTTAIRLELKVPDSIPLGVDPTVTMKASDLRKGLYLGIIGKTNTEPKDVWVDVVSGITRKK